MRSVREGRIVTRDGVRLRVEERNAGGGRPAVLLLHGFTGSVEAWGDRLLDRLSDVIHVIALDLPGHGGSDAPEDPERYRLERVLDDVEDVLNAVDVEAPIWVGYSMGGRVALGGAVLRPGRVRGMVLEGASPGIAEPEARRERRMADEARARRIESGAPAAMEDFVDEWMELPLFASQQRLPDEVLEEQRTRRLAGDPRGLAAALRGLGTGRQPSFWPRLGEVTVPVLLLTGSLDRKYEDIADAMASELPDARRRTVEGAGHTVHLESPSEWLDAVRSFVAELAEAPE